MNGLAQLIPFVLIAAIFYLLLIRPQRRRQQEMAQTQRGVQVGDEVMLGSGIYGYVAEVEDDRVHLEISPGVRMRVARQAVVRVIRPEEPEPGEPPSAEPEPPPGPQDDVPGPQRDS